MAAARILSINSVSNKSLIIFCRLTGCPQIESWPLWNFKDAGGWLWADHIDEGRAEVVARDDNSEPHR
jgi:hypothetical protein